LKTKIEISTNTLKEENWHKPQSVFSSANALVAINGVHTINSGSLWIWV